MAALVFASGPSVPLSLWVLYHHVQVFLDKLLQPVSLDDDWSQRLMQVGLAVDATGCALSRPGSSSRVQQDSQICMLLLSHFE